MGNMAKQIQANEDKKFLLKKTGKTPKHRCPVCHRFSMWFISKDGKSRNCYWCTIMAQNNLMKKANNISKLNKEVK